MRKIAKTFLIIAACLAAFGNVAKAQESTSGNINKIGFTLGYADPDYDQEFGNDKASLFSKFDLTQEEHELNDAWLGMPVKSSQGKLVGTVAYAFVDADGEINELLVELGASKLGYAVYIEGNTAILTDIEVLIDLNATQIANLEREQPSKLAQK